MTEILIYIGIRAGIAIVLCILLEWACTRAMNPKRKKS